MMAGNAAEHSQHTLVCQEAAAGLVSQAAAFGVRLETREAGRLWANKPNLLTAELRNSLAAHRPAVIRLLAERQHIRAGPLVATVLNALLTPPLLPGVPLHWREGVGLLATVPAPSAVPPRRWAALAASAFRLVRDHGAELHTAGWNALDLFGLHSIAPLANPTGWGLAWLLGAAGEVLDVAPEAVGMRHGPGGARLVFHQRRARERSGIRLAWNVPGNPA